ncbi:hypothetical protein MKW92_020968 [Papaver armeniacum]|nr:hypothetical protein MKW92_020968 [Papaver armeniacum]
MDVSVLMLSQKCSLLEEELEKKFNLFKYWEVSDKDDFLKENSEMIKAIVRCGNSVVDADLIDALPNLEIISSFSAGLDRVDLKKCREKRITVTNTPVTDDVADLAIALILATLRNICPSDRYIRNGLWKKGDFGLATKFTGKRVGMLGLGSIGKAIAERVEGFHCPISYCTTSRKTGLKYKYYGNIVDLALNSDILVVACPLTPETHKIINREVLDALGPKGVLINVGRGPHIDEPELVSALTDGRIGGAGLDVFEDEPDVPEALFALDNVVLSPHAGSRTSESRQEMRDFLIGNLEAYFMKKPLLSAVV